MSRIQKKPRGQLQYMDIEVLRVAIQEYLEKRQINDSPFHVVDVNGGIVFDVIFPKGDGNETS